MSSVDVVLEFPDKDTAKSFLEWLQEEGLCLHCEWADDCGLSSIDSMDTEGVDLDKDDEWVINCK